MIELNRSWFPNSSDANNFGWDALTASHNRPEIWPRIHLANDYWATDGNAFNHPFKTIVSGAVKLLKDDGTDYHNSILYQFAGPFEIQYWHIRPVELSSDIIAADTARGAVVQAGTIIGPAGDVGIGTGRHVHLTIKAKDGTDLAPLLGDLWNKDKTVIYTQRYGPTFTEKKVARNIKWMNDNVIYRRVGDGPMAYYINPKAILG